jgi:YHS domain-containing protein
MENPTASANVNSPHGDSTTLPGLFRLIFFTLLAWIASRFLIKVFRAAAPKSPGPTQVPPQEAARSISERLVRDPVCGLALPESRALQHGGEFFCSTECRDRFIAERPS